jgi:hypothetical protein
MQTQLLVKMLQLALDNNYSKSLAVVLRQVALDTELNDTVVLEDFSNEVYSVRSLYYIKKCLNFKL